MAGCDRTTHVGADMGHSSLICLVGNAAMVVLNLYFAGPSISNELLVGMATFNTPFSMILSFGAATILPRSILRYWVGRTLDVLLADEQAARAIEVADQPDGLLEPLNGVGSSQVPARPIHVQHVRAVALPQAPLHRERVVLEPVHTNLATRYRIPTGVFRFPETPSTASLPSPFVQSRVPDPIYQTQATEQPAAETQPANSLGRRCTSQTECDEPHIKNVTDFPPRLEDHNHDFNICNECIQPWLNFEIANTVPCSRIHCPEVGCGVRLRYHDIQRFATPDLFQAYDRATLRDTMNNDPDTVHLALAHSARYILTFQLDRYPYATHAGIATVSNAKSHGMKTCPAPSTRSRFVVKKQLSSNKPGQKQRDSKEPEKDAQRR